MQLRYASSRRIVLVTAALAAVAAPSYMGVANARPTLPGSWSVTPTSVTAGSGPTDYAFRYTSRTTTTDGSASASVGINSAFGTPQNTAPTSPDFVTLVKGTCDVTSAHITLYDAFTPPRVAIEGFKCVKANQYVQFALKKVTAPSASGVYSFPTYFYSSGVGSVIPLAPVTVTVTPGAASKLVFVPASLGAGVGPFSFIAGNTMQTTAVAVEDTFSNVVPSPSVSVTISSSPLSGGLTKWTTNGIAQFNDLTGTLAGLSYAFTASSGSLTPAVGAYNIYPAALDHLGLSPADDTIPAGGSDTYSAEGFDAFDNSLGDVTGDTVFTIDFGSCFGFSTCQPLTVPGVYTVTGTDGTAVGSTSLTVVAAALNHLVLSPADATIASGDSQAYTAEGYDAFDNDLGDKTSETTFDVNGDTAQCSGATCTPTGLAPEVVTVNGTDGTATGSTTLNVREAITAITNPDASYLSSTWPTQCSIFCDWYDLLDFNGSGSDVASGSDPAVSYTGASSYEWNMDVTSPADDVNRSVVAPDGSSYRATTRYANDSFQITLSYTAAHAGHLSLYAVDWDSTSRGEDVTVDDGTLAQTIHLSNFHDGVWVGVPIDVASGGEVTITVTHTDGDNAVLSEILQTWL